jgi:hypothetical protein
MPFSIVFNIFLKLSSNFSLLLRNKKSTSTKNLINSNSCAIPLRGRHNISAEFCYLSVCQFCAFQFRRHHPVTKKFIQCTIRKIQQLSKLTGIVAPKQLRKLIKLFRSCQIARAPKSPSNHRNGTSCQSRGLPAWNFHFKNAGRRRKAVSPNKVASSCR